MSGRWSQCPWGKSSAPTEGSSLSLAIQPAVVGITAMRAEQSPAPTEIIAAGSIFPDAAVIAAGVGGTHSASDTPRSMSGMWSLCPWGSPALRWVLTPVAVYPTPVGNRRPTRAIRESPLRCFLPAVGFSVGADASAARLPVGGMDELYRWFMEVSQPL